jgi:hypothetical protein
MSHDRRIDTYAELRLAEGKLLRCERERKVVRP